MRGVGATTLAGLVAIGCLVSTSSAQTEATQTEVIGGRPIEVLPDHIVNRIVADGFEASADSLVDQNRVSQGVLMGAKRWDPSSPIRVCFFGGSTSVRRRIASVASAWENVGAPIRFDFGDRNDPQMCRAGQLNQIRVGYSQRGYWSLIGQDSIVYAPQTEQSLNLAMFDFNSPAEPEFTQVVLHEFGHALGFGHEHQHDLQGCDAEFNWPLIYSYLQGPPNSWSRETIDHNMRSRPYLAGNVRTDYDPESIMLYAFPPQFYRQGTASRCYSAGNSKLSEKDGATMRLAYSTTGRQQATAALAAAAPSLPAAERGEFASRLQFFDASLATKARILGVGDRKFTDIDVRSCSATPASMRLSDEVAKVLAVQPRIGQLRYAGLYTASPRVTRGVSVVSDLPHPETADARRLVTALSAEYAGTVSLVGNQSRADRWLLTVVACAD